MKTIQSLLAGIALVIFTAPTFGQNANFVVVGPTAAAAWDSSSGTWVLQSGSFTMAAGNAGNLGVAGASQAAAFNDTPAAWTTLGSGGVQLEGSAGNFGVRAAGSVSAWNKASSAWISQALPGVINLEGSGGGFGASVTGPPNASAWNPTTSTWANHNANTGYGTLLASQGNFLLQFGPDDAAAYRGSAGTWHNIPEAGMNQLLASAGNFVLAQTNGGGSAWAWNSNTAAWNQAYALGGGIDMVASSGNFAFRVTTINNGYTYAWDNALNTWVLGVHGFGGVWQRIAGSEGNFAVINSVFGGQSFMVYEKGSGAWVQHGPPTHGGTILVGSGGNFAYGGPGSHFFTVWKPGAAPTDMTGFGSFGNVTQIVGSGGNFVGQTGSGLLFWNSANSTFALLGGTASSIVGSDGNIGIRKSDGAAVAIRGKPTGTPAWAGSGITATSDPMASAGNFGFLGANSATRYSKSVGANGTFHDLTITGVSEMKASGGNFVVRGSSEVAAIDDNSTSWNTLTLAANRVEASGGNAAALSSSASTAAAWDQADSTWYSLTSFANNGLTLAGSDGNFAALGLSDVAAWNQTDNTWYSFAGSFSGLLGGGGSFVAYGSTGAAVWEPSDNQWNFLSGDYSFLAAASIPEPASFGLVGLGIGAILWRRRFDRG